MGLEAATCPHSGQTGKVIVHLSGRVVPRLRHWPKRIVARYVLTTGRLSKVER